MSKKPRSPKPRVRVEEPPWNSSVEGVLRHALEIHAKYGYTDIVVIGTRRTTPEMVISIDTLTFTTDKFRVAGIIRWALDRLLAR